MRPAILMGMGLVMGGVLGLTGCGGSDSGKVQAFYDKLAPVYCAKLEDCCSATGTVDPQNDCKTFMGTFGGLEMQHLVDDGQVKFDTDAAAACLSALKAMDNVCGDTGGSADCAGAFIGLVADGGACTSDSACAAPGGGIAECEIAGEDEKGTCNAHPRLKVGQTCDRDCHGTTDTYSCFTLDAAPGKGDCFLEDGLRCDAATFKCVALATDGGACQSSSDCAQGLYCTSPDAVCRPLVAVGGACTADSDCVENICDEAHTCVAPLSVGATCDTNAFSNVCGSGAWCDEGGKCQASTSMGDAFACSLVTANEE